MDKIREIIAYKTYFEDFLQKQPIKVQNKIFKILEAIETLEMIPANYLKLIAGTKGLYEARIQVGTNIWRVFCFFDSGRLVILLNGFMTPFLATGISHGRKVMGHSASMFLCLKKRLRISTISRSITA